MVKFCYNVSGIILKFHHLRAANHTTAVVTPQKRELIPKILSVSPSFTDNSSDEKALVTSIPNSYIESVVYTGVSTPHCGLHVEYQSNNTNLHLYYVEIEYSKGETIPELTPKRSFINESTKATLIALLPPSNSRYKCVDYKLMKPNASLGRHFFQFW